MRPNHFSLLVVLFLALVSTALASTTWYVDGVSGFDGNNCTSPTTACKTIAHAIEAAVSGDSILVAPATYTENLSISKNLRILGSGATTTIIDGGGARVVTIQPSAHVTLTDMTIRNGVSKSDSGSGGVANFNGVLTLTRIVVTGNSGLLAGGLENEGSLTINSSTISGNTVTRIKCVFFCFQPGGGGIRNLGALTIHNSIISGNSEEVTPGGGILNGYGGRVTISRSTISGDSGDGIFNLEGPATISQSTFSGNRGAGIGGGSIFIHGPMSVSVINSTISGNGGGIGVSFAGRTRISLSNRTVSGNSGTGISVLDTTNSNVALKNSIVANNSGGNCSIRSGTLTSVGHNLSSDATCDFGSTGDLTNIDPMLGPLQKNGGPTQTMALPSGSPAIDAGNPHGCRDNLGNLLNTDQRGMPRHDKEDTGGCDMGAYESQRD